MPYRQLSLEDIPTAHPVAVFSAFWRSVAGKGGLVPWTAFDPSDHKDVLPWILLLKRAADADPAVSKSWHYAVCGTGCTQLFGRSSQGKVFGDGLSAPAIEERQAEIDQLVAGSDPLYSHTNVPIQGRDFVQVIRGVFPFTASGRVVDCLLFVIAREDKRLSLAAEATASLVHADQACAE